MPRTNIDYSNTSIYKLCCKDINITEVYVGHTTCMRRRKCQHKSSCNNENAKDYNYNVYQFIRNNGGWDNWDMIEIERFEAIDGYDAKKRERYWIEELKATLNCKLPTQTHKDYYESNKEIISEKSAVYRANNKEKILQKNKLYYENNKEKILQKNKEYNENNKEYFHNYYAEKIECECGCFIRRDDIARHKRSKKHNDLIQLVSNEHTHVRILS